MLGSTALFCNIVLMDDSITYCSCCLASSGWNKVIGLAVQAGDSVPPASTHSSGSHLINTRERGQERVCLDLCKPIASQKGCGAHALWVQVITLICIHEGQHLPIWGEVSFKVQGHRMSLFLYFSSAVSIFFFWLFLLSYRGTWILYWYCNDMFFEEELPVLEMSGLEESAIMSLWDNDMCV